MQRDRPALKYQPMERVPVVRPVDRIAYVKAQCQGLRVLDLGAMDETAYSAKRGRGTWLHEEIASVAHEVTGIDSSALLAPEGLRTAANAWIFPGDIMQLAAWLAPRAIVPDIVVAGELIEHLENPLDFLRSLKATAVLRGKTLLMSTPNATALHNGLVGLLSRESTHPDHLSILSYKTLNTLCLRAGFASWEIIPYYARFTEMKERNPGALRALIGAGEAGINGLEWLFPLLSFGYVVRAVI
jgi:hypothetical protein